MKTIKYILTLILFITPLVSCENIEDLLEGEIDIPVTFVIDINGLAVPENSDPNAPNFFIGSAIYDILSNPNIADVIGTPEQIKKIVINSLQYQYRNFAGNVDAVISGEMKFIVSGNQLQSFNTLPINVAEASFTTEQFDLQGIEGVEISLNNNGLVAVSHSGTSTFNPIIFDNRLIINATVTVDVNIDDL
jgi:hypothetical protein